MNDFKNILQLLSNTRNKIPKLTSEGETLAKKICNDFDKFDHVFVNFITCTNTLNLTDLFDEINAIRLELRHVQHTVPIRKSFLNTLTIIVTLLQDHWFQFYVAITEIYVENLLFSIEETTEENSELFLATIRSFSFYFQTVNNYCGIERFLPEIIDAIEKALQHQNTENNKSEMEVLLQKHCDCLKFYELLLKHSSTCDLIKKNLIKKYVPIAHDILNGKDEFPVNNYVYIKVFCEMMTTLTRRVEADNFGLNGVSCSLRPKL